MNLHDTQAIKTFKEVVYSDLFNSVGISLSFTLACVDKDNGVTIPELEIDDLNGLLSRIYLYFIDPIPTKHYQGYAYDFFDTRLAQAKHLNPSKNLYDYGMNVLHAFLLFVKKIEPFFSAAYQCYMDHLCAIKTLKDLTFDERDVFCELLNEYVE